jgi:hypothetical protein
MVAVNIFILPVRDETKLRRLTETAKDSTADKITQGVDALPNCS